MKQKNTTPGDTANRQIWRKATEAPVTGGTLENCYRHTDIYRCGQLSTSRRVRWEGHVWGERKRVYRVLVQKAEGKRPLRTFWLGWENIIKDFKEIGCEGTEWIDLAQNRDDWRAVVNAVMNLRVS
jgi:hypothetical protein